MQLEELALSVARCPDVQRARGMVHHPCHDIVSLQSTHPDAFQVPEPWAGNLRDARIAFVSSNPSISEGSDSADPDDAEDYPRTAWPDGTLTEFMTSRFEGKWATADGRFRQLDGGLSAPVRFWRGVRNRATEIVGVEADPCRDYVMTEVVHCKSRSERGVKKAAPYCLRRHLGSILTASAAPLLVVLGSKARDLLVDEWELPHGFGRRSHVGVNEAATLAVRNVGGRHRVVAFLWHPTGMTAPKTFTAAYPRYLHHLQALVHGRMSPAEFASVLQVDSP